MMKKVLITNLYIQSYTGSELHTLEIAKGFQSRGYEPVVATYRKTLPLSDMFAGIKLIDLQNEELPYTEYDIIFVQHFAVFDFIITRYPITYKKMIISKLSVISDLELLPIYADKADLVVCVSEEVQENVIQNRIPLQKTFVFCNYATSMYFDHYHQKTAFTKPEKIAVISNHPPQEVLDLKNNSDFKIDYIGLHQQPKLVDLGLLKQYDLIITIGRTAQYCFAAGIPVYIYDYFGGPGFINENNFNLASHHNYSGRGFGQKENAEIINDITHFYDDNLKSLDFLHKLAEEKYQFDTLFDEMLNQIIISESDEFIAADFYSPLLAQMLKTYSGRLSSVIANVDIGLAQLYQCTDEIPYSEEFSTTFLYRYEYTCTVKATAKKGVTKLRFDPDDKLCECRIISVKLGEQAFVAEPVNGITNTNGNTLFLTNDGQYEINLGNPLESEQMISICFSCTPISDSVVDKYLNLQKEEYHLLQHEYNLLKYEHQRLLDEHSISKLLKKNIKSIIKKPMK